MAQLRSIGMFGLVLSLVLLPVCRAADAPAADADSLKDKGLVKAGQTYVLPTEQELADEMKNLRKLKLKLDQDGKKRKELEAKLLIYKNGISNLDHQRRTLYEQYLKLTDVTQKNQTVVQVNILDSKLQEANGVREDLEKNLNGLGAEEKTQFINSVIDLGMKVDKTQDQYKDLNADPDVKHTIETMNQPGKPRMKLGPSPEFVANMAALKRWRGDVSSDIIEIKNDNNRLVVEVTFNGTLTRDMILDSGASIVSLTADLAKQLNMIPTEKDQTIHIVMADGKQVDAKLMTLKSVRVGQFTVVDVECAVLPASLVAAEPLLGMTYLNNFVFKIDPKA
ncbi:MAG TPA: retropepsin-like aspartic protease, partial [Humisphaera sp.]|nr:retropepsin-like aspartic protease [Humisphaera sp.]